MTDQSLQPSSCQWYNLLCSSTSPKNQSNPLTFLNLNLGTILNKITQAGGHVLIYMSRLPSPQRPSTLPRNSVHFPGLLSNLVQSSLETLFLFSDLPYYRFPSCYMSPTSNLLKPGLFCTIVLCFLLSRLNSSDWLQIPSPPASQDYPTIDFPLLLQFTFFLPTNIFCIIFLFLL